MLGKLFNLLNKILYNQEHTSETLAKIEDVLWKMQTEHRTQYSQSNMILQILNEMQTPKDPELEQPPTINHFYMDKDGLYNYKAYKNKKHRSSEVEE